MRKKRREGLSAVMAGKMPGRLTVGVFLFLLTGLVFGLAGNTAQAGLADHAVINELSIQGSSGAGGSYDDWVELYNPTDQAVDLTGWSIQKSPSSGSTIEQTSLSGSLAASGYLLIVRNNASTTQSLKDQADILADSDLFSLASNNIFYLVDDSVNISTTTDPNIVDFVGLGSADFYEGTSTAPNPGAGKSLARIPDGEDTDQNYNDFKVGTPTPANSGAGDDDLGGTVLLTITPAQVPTQNISPTGAQIVFQVNGVGTALVKYGLDAGYASSTAPSAVTANATTTISLSGLACSTEYHYAIYAENLAGTENDTTSDAVFITLPCGITVDSLVMTKSSAKANNQYLSGWEWKFNLTVWDMNETSLKMKFNQWAGAGVLDAGANMRFSADNGVTWTDIAANATYPEIGASLTGIDNDEAAAGRQVEILVKMKVPVGTAAGYYNSSYGILTE